MYVCSESMFTILAPTESTYVVYFADYKETLEIESIENSMEVKCGGVLRDNGKLIETAVTLNCVETV